MSSTFVPTAEAAFIAGLSDRDMNRVLDEHLVPDDLVQTDKNVRLFSRLSAAFARFYFDAEPFYAASLRKLVLVELATRVHKSAKREVLLSLKRSNDMDWLVVIPFGRVDVSTFVADAAGRARQVEHAHDLIKTDPGVMGGVPVFAGTRVPIEIVTSSLEKGVDAKRLQKAYAFLTDEHVEAARVYAKVHPRRGRPRLVSEANPGWPVKSRTVVRPARA